MQTLQLGQIVTLKLNVITPVKAKVVELGNTYAILESHGDRRRVLLRDAHHVIQYYYKEDI